ncbi:MAG: hypothetical protein ABSH20_15515 [Tepidisphaeraceae bacterium]
MGRKQTPYIVQAGPDKGKVIQGLYRATDGRWKILETGERFTETDEFKAISRFREWERKASKPQPLNIKEPVSLFHKMTDSIPQYALWSWLREQLIERPEWVANKVNIPQLANLKNLNLPKQGIKLADLLKSYVDYAMSHHVTQSKVSIAWGDMVKSTQAKTALELTTDRPSSQQIPAVPHGHNHLLQIGHTFHSQAVGADPVDQRAPLGRGQHAGTGTAMATALLPVEPQVIGPATREHAVDKREPTSTWRDLPRGLARCDTAHFRVQNRTADRRRVSVSYGLDLTYLQSG